MTVPNLLTLFRLILVIPFCFFVTGGLQYDMLAFLTFVLAAFTDWFDGFYARRYKEFSEAGKLFDPLADKLLVSAALIALVQDPVIRLPVWSVVAILGREFLITGLRGILAEHRQVMAASNLGKAKTVSQIIAVLLLLVTRTPGSASFLVVSYTAYYVAVALTVLSAVEYIWNHKDFLAASFRRRSES